MQTKRHIRSIVLLMATIAAMVVGCTNISEDNGGVTPSGNATLTLTVGSSDTGRQLGTQGSAVAGEKMNNLVLLMVEDNLICRRVDLQAGDAEFNASQTEAHVVLTDLEVGDHTLYIVANSGSLTALNLANYTQGTTMTTAQRNALTEALSGVALADTALPTYSEQDGMPMTAVVEFTLKHGTNRVSAEVERVVARLGVVVNNHILDDKYKVVVSGAKLSNFNSSATYLFNHDGSLPATNTYRPFAIDARPQYVSNGGVLALIDDYIYETDPSATYEFEITVGVFDAASVGDTPPEVVEVDGGPDTSVAHNVVIVGHQYFMYNVNNGRYLYVNSSGSLAMATSVPTSDYEDYLWSFSGEDSGTIQNVGTGRYVSRSNANISTTTNSGSAETFTFGVNSGYAYMRSSYYYNRYYYFLANSNNSPALTRGSRNSTVPNSNNQRWILYVPKVSSGWSVPPIAEVTHSAALSRITPDGRVVPLEEIRRNENVQIGINLFYNPEDGYFNFEVVPWQEGKGGDAIFD